MPKHKHRLLIDVDRGNIWDVHMEDGICDCCEFVPIVRNLDTAIVWKPPVIRYENEEMDEIELLADEAGFSLDHIKKMTNIKKKTRRSAHEVNEAAQLLRVAINLLDRNMVSEAKATLLAANGKLETLADEERGS